MSETVQWIIIIAGIVILAALMVRRRIKARRSPNGNRSCCNCSSTDCALRSTKNRHRQ